jgi:subtilisin-like proprotein convertase family protein
VENTTVVLDVAGSAPPKTALSSPGDGAAWIDVLPEFSWDQSAEASDYLLEIDDEPSFSSVDYSASCEGTTHVPTAPLAENTVFYWRVSPGNICGQGEASDVFSFKTGGPAPSMPGIPIPDNDPEGISDAIVVSENGSISDLEIFVHIAHEWIGNVSVVLEHEETSTSAVLADRPGYPSSLHGCSGDDMEAWLDDDAEFSVEFECEFIPPAIEGDLIPQEALSAFAGESAAGRWILRVYDNAKSDQGTLLEWGVDFHGQGELPIRIRGDRVLYFDSISKAYENISQDDTIEAMAVSFAEEGLTLDRPLLFLLEGGLDEDFEAGGGLTEIQGPVVVSDGTAVLSNVAIR